VHRAGECRRPELNSWLIVSWLSPFDAALRCLGYHKVVVGMDRSILQRLSCTPRWFETHIRGFRA
jgi:hypothetical protein